MNRELLPVQVNKVWLAIDAAYVQEILGRRPWVAIPGARTQLPGVLAWRSRAVAVVDIGTVAGISEPLAAGEARERTVVVQVGPVTLALMADAIREVRLLPEDQIKMPHATQQRYASHEVELDGVPVPILDLLAIVKAVSPAAEAAA